MSGENELGFTFEEVKSGQWRDKTWIDVTKHEFYGINVNYDANMVYCGEGINLRRELEEVMGSKKEEKAGGVKNMGRQESEVKKVLLVDVAKDHFYVEFPTKEAMLVSKAMELVENAVDDRDKAISQVMKIIKKADGAKILIDMNYEAMKPE
ncbi:MAG: hypothetical protein JHC26_11870 [Thermofilum sp.]|jgi:hypothetical protein|uniref:hypothetical protein n=1 Tax=Thermofilum sp. TaxID=1961369 RepID=UPI0025877204|nr:hypothetical protein [Thermofilum sp.]MCI4409781.1 hypothetical protein [Thermofilum sp.]